MKKILFLCLLISSMTFAQKPIFTTAKAVAATVYFNGAELSQATTVNLPAGSSEIVVKNVADNLNENTVRIGAPAGLTVLSVQFTRDYIAEYEADETSPAIKKVRDSISLVQKELERTATAKASELKVLELLDKNNQVYGQQSGLSVTELMKMVDYYKAKRTETATAINTLTEKEKKLNELLAKLNSRLETDTTTDDDLSEGKLVLQVMNDKAGTIPLTIDYLAQNAGWTPFYDLRADNITEPINLLYKAEVVQQTGLDWKKIKLTLSSGMPNQSNIAPSINPWFLTTYNPLAYTSNGFANVTETLQGQVAGVAISTGQGQPGANSTVILRGYGSMNGNIEPLYVIDGVPDNADNFRSLNPKEIVNIEVLKDAGATAIYGNRGANGVIIVTTKKGKFKEKASVDKFTQVTENQMNVSFDIDIPYDILSNGKKHSITMKEIKLPAFFRHLSVPKLEEEAFLMAEITDYSKYNLLKGEANIIFEGMYAGKTYIDPGQTTDTLSLSMGRDKKIDIERTKVVEKSGSKFLSSKKEETFTYDIIVRNNKKEAVQLTVKDQYPLSTLENMEVELLESSGADVDEETGILQWQMKLKPGETKKVRLSYRVRHPKDVGIGNL
ncbi:hypothetical protein HYN59_05525 [Flavobacterium album]|uniref:TonB-dependent receptor n=1 Tax=Flavobacterium album TaxID=2175091 RepID=A0A2S1QWA1_9FLAO|nr:DUF4139 domain-containing protein [Flavobacterium album]AWH84609.1 hypothetical protein HYN59_05525 [Flavobacterium album]